MKHKQDIEKIYQDNRHGLDERPSERAWNRLESRLDGSPSIQRRPRPAFRLMGMAAGILFLVSMIALMSVLFQQTTNQTASKDVLSLPVMEELEKFKNEKGVYAIAVSFQEYLNQSPKTIAERNNKKRLLYPNDAYRSNANANPIASAQLKKDENQNKKADLAENAATKDAAKEAAMKNKILEATQREAANYDKVSSPKPPVQETEEVIVATASEMEDQATAIEEGLSYESNANYAEAESAPDDYATPKAQKSRTQSPPASSKIEARDLDAASNVISYSTDSSPNGLEQFQWLIGQWNSSLGYGKENIEQWVQKDEFTIEGSGQLVVNGDTIFTEGMKIQKIGDQLYYILALDEKQKEVRFKLQSIDPQMAIFETEEKRKPNQQLILEQHSLNNFSTTLQNADPEPLKGKQLQYLQNRNNVELNKRSVRNMSRSY